MPIGLGIGIGISIGGGGAGGAGFPSIQLSGQSIAEDAAGDAEIGTASVANAPEGVTYTWAITSDPDSKFAIDENTGVLTLATLATLDYETATSHQVTIEATPDVGDPPSPRTFTITVTNVIEAPVNTVAPAITGDLDGILTCSTGTWTDMGAGSYAYQWKDASDDSDLTGETANTLDSQDHIGLEVYCTVTATNSADSTAADSNTVGPLVELVIPDTTAPTLSSPAAIADGDTAADLSVDTNEANGTLYWVVTQSATSPSAAQVKAGQNHAGAAADDAGSEAVVGTGEQVATATGLTAETTYYAHFMHEDAAANQSGVVSSSSFTTDAASETPIGLLVALGDSVTASGDPTENYADDGAAATDPLLNFNNEGINGTGAQDWLDEIATTLAPFDEVPDTEPKIITVMLGNTLDHEGGSVGAIAKAIELFDAIRRSSNNIKVVQVGDFSRTGGFDVVRAVTNAWGAANVGLYLDAFIDMTNELPDGMGENGAAENETWYPQDGIHPGPLIHSAAAPIYATDIDALVAAFLADVTAPEIVRLAPLDGATTVQPDEFPFVARFNEHVKFGSSVDIGIYDASDDSLVEGWDETDIDSGIAIHGVDLEITPSGDLDPGDYYIQIASGSIEDISGNAFAGITDETTWNFTVPVVLDLTPSLMAFWELGEASGTRADSVGSNDLSDNNTVTQTTGKVGDCAVFASANSEYLEISDNADLGYNGDFSAATWFYWNGPSSPFTIASKGNNTFAQNEWRLYVSFGSGHNLTAAVYRSGGTAVTASIASALSTGTWYFGVLTYTASTRVMTISLNAGTRATNTLADAPARKTQPFRIGSFGTNYWDGRIDQFGFWKRVLSVEEEAWLYNLGNGRTYAEIAATGA